MAERFELLGFTIVVDRDPGCRLGVDVIVCVGDLGWGGRVIRQQRNQESICGGGLLDCLYERSLACTVVCITAINSLQHVGRGSLQD